MYGIIPKQPTENGKNEHLLTTSRLIQCLVIPPQHGTSTTILKINPPVSNPPSDLSPPNVTASISNASYLTQFIPLGMIYTIGQQDGRFLSPAQCVQHCQWFDYISHHHNLQHIKEQSPDGKLESLFNLQSTATITIAYSPGTCTLNSFTISKEGYEWYQNSPNAKLDPQGQIISESDYSTKFFNTQSSPSIQLTNRIYGYCMSPLDQVWNYSFMKLRFKHDLLTILTISPPIPFYHYKHRRSHFLNFVKTGLQQQQQAANANAQDALNYDQSINQLEDDSFQ
jgi:pre-mRNA-processing factor 8